MGNGNGNRIAFAQSKCKTNKLSLINDAKRLARVGKLDHAKKLGLQLGNRAAQRVAGRAKGGK